MPHSASSILQRLVNICSLEDGFRGKVMVPEYFLLLNNAKKPQYNLMLTLPHRREEELQIT